MGRRRRAISREDARTQKDITVPKSESMDSIGEAIATAICVYPHQPIEVHAQEFKTGWRIRMTYARNLW